MSTRSGKRIHSSLLEDSAAPEHEPTGAIVKSERKARSKRVKDNSDDLSVSIFKNKKRNNYVSYPTDDELLGVTATKHEDYTKTIRALRKNALKEQNPVEICEDEDTQTDAKNLVRKSRRGKRLDNAEDENHENIPAGVTELPKSKKSKKKKKVNAVIDNRPPSEEAPAKKSKKKKGKKTSSIISKDVTQNNHSNNVSVNKSNMSVDSFYSAAGSPDKIKHNYMNTEHVNKLTNTLKKIENEEIIKSTAKTNKKSNKNIMDNNDVSLNMSMNKDKENKINTFDKGSRKRKPISHEITFDKCYVSMTRDNLEKDLERINYPNLSNGQLQKIKSNSRDATLDKSNNSTNVIFEKDVENNLDVSNISNKKLKRRSANKNEVKDVENILEYVDDTFDKGLRSRNSITIFDKSNASITKEDIKVEEIDLNVSYKHPKARKSILKGNTVDKSNVSMTAGDAKVEENDLNVFNKQHKTRSIVKDTTFNKSYTSITNGNNIEKDAEPDLNIFQTSYKKQRKSRSNRKDSTFDKPDQAINTTFEKDTEIVEKRKENQKDSTFDKSNSKIINATYEKNIHSDSTNTATAKGKEKKSSVNSTFDKNDKANDITFENEISTSFDAFKKGVMTRKSSISNVTFDKSNTSIASLTKEDFEKDNNIVSSLVMKRISNRRSTFDINDKITENVNTTYEKISNTENEPKRKSPRISQTNSDVQITLNTTFEKETFEDEKENMNSDTKSSLISSDNSSVTDKSNISRISITSDDTEETIENIVNTTPLLIESSMDVSHISATKQESPKPQTPLKREGTFTKDGPEVQTQNDKHTPTKRKSSPIPSAGCTPYHISKSSQKKSMLNVTRSIEKGSHASVDPTPRMTKVMFCSPVDNPLLAAQEKRKIIKSNLKGSNKSFVFEDSASISRLGRKRSFTQSDAENARVKRTCLAEDLQQSVDRLSRPRTASATAKLSVTTPKKPITPKKPTNSSKPKSEAKPIRTKLPNFATLHQKQFDQMESLDECQERRAKRAKQLLTPTAPPGLLERISPKNNAESSKAKETAKAKDTVIPKDKTDTPTKKLPTLESLRPGFTRFGFKLNLDINPFSIPSKTEKEKPKEKPVEKRNGVPPRKALLPSLAGATSVRRETAQLTVMREKSFTDKRKYKRNENRTIIKGVRTNRRFELQMKMRNID